MTDGPSDDKTRYPMIPNPKAEAKVATVHADFRGITPLTLTRDGLPSIDSHPARPWRRHQVEVAIEALAPLCAIAFPGIFMVPRCSSSPTQEQKELNDSQRS